MEFAYEFSQDGGMSTNAERFGLLVRQRRDDLALSQMEVWQAGGPSNTTLTTIENGHATSLQNATAKKLDKALQWAPGSAREAWGGGDPRPLGTAAEDEIRAMKLPPDTEARILAVLEADRAQRGYGRSG